MSSSRPYSVSSSSMVPPDLSLRAPPPPRPVQNRKQNKTAVPLRQAAAGKNPSPAARDYSIAISRRTVMRHCTAYYTLSRKCVGGPAPGIFALRIFSNYQHVARAQVGGHFAIRAPQGGHRGVVLTGNAGEGFSPAHFVGDPIACGSSAQLVALLVLRMFGRGSSRRGHFPLPRP